MHWAQSLPARQRLKIERLEIVTLIKKHIAITLLITALSLALPSVITAQSNADVEKVRAKVRTLAASSDSQVEIKFRDKTKAKGYITAVEPVSFTLKDAKAGTSQSITYAEVDSVGKAGGSSTKTWLIIGGVAAGVVTTWLLVKPAVCDGGAQTGGVC